RPVERGSDSVAVLVTTRVAKPLTVRLVCTGSVGALFKLLTITVKLLVTLKGGNPLSLTVVVIKFVEGACPWVGVQRMIPLVSMVAPAGGSSKEYDNSSGGLAGSVAVLVTTSVRSSLMVWLECPGNTGPLGLE